MNAVDHLDVLLDQVNELDEPVGIIRRRDVFKEGAGFRVIHIFITNNAGHLLLEHLGLDAERSPGKWGSSVAGYVHAGESYAQAAKRRLLQERGLSTPLRTLGARTMPDAGARKFITLYTTQVEIEDNPGPEEANYVKWFEHDDITRLLRKDPARFTETFPYVYHLYRALTA